ncbi:MAG: DUF6206 family protein [Candidatus Thorarchaeota archaeon]
MEIDTDLLMRFEEGLNPAKPEESPIPAHVLGYGEISTVFEILHEGQSDIAFKRMPLFDTMEQVERYRDVYNRYHDHFKQIGIDIPEYGSEVIETGKGRIVLYLYQRKLPAESIGNSMIHQMSESGVKNLIQTVLSQLNKVWEFNMRNSPDIEVAIDGQISNWAVKNYPTNIANFDGGSKLFYFDTSTPLFRENNEEQLDVELFLKPTPPGIRWYLKKYYLQDIVDRYYDFRKVAIDLVANFLKEQRSELVPDLVKLVNEYFASETAVSNIEPITVEEIEEYYKDDASTWSLYLKMRKAHRFFKTKIMRGYYAYILPADIQR